MRRLQPGCVRMSRRKGSVQRRGSCTAAALTYSLYTNADAFLPAGAASGCTSSCGLHFVQLRASFSCTNAATSVRDRVPYSREREIARRILPSASRDAVRRVQIPRDGPGDRHDLLEAFLPPQHVHGLSSKEHHVCRVDRVLALCDSVLTLGGQRAGSPAYSWRRKLRISPSRSTRSRPRPRRHQTTSCRTSSWSASPCDSNTKCTTPTWPLRVCCWTCR